MRRLAIFAVGVTAVAALAAGVIGSSRAIDQRTSGLDSPGNDGSGRSDIPDPVVASSPPQCPPCWKPVEFGENFDGVMPPMLPPGWVATNVQGPPPMWVTSNSGVPSPPADTLPNAAFIDDPGVISDKLLDLPGLTVFETISQQLTFRHNFNLEASADDLNLGFDGGVLEISVDQGQTFHDILEVGGIFVTGGYNRTISTDRGSPIAGRQAWSGNSGGFITTTVLLPGIIIEGTLRWRMASDNTGSGEGWRVDTIDISWCQGPPCSPTPTATATSTATPRPTPSPRLRPSPAPRPTPPR